MSKKTKIRVGEKERRAQQRRIALEKELAKEVALEEMEAFEGELPPEDDAALLSKESDAEGLEKHYMSDSGVEIGRGSTGAVTFDELDEQIAAEKKARKIRGETWNVQDLVRNIVNNPMLEPQEKATFIKQAGNDFGDRVSVIMDTPAKMLKESDLEVLELEALLAKDERNMGFLQKTFGGLFQKDKVNVRNALALAAEQISKGGAEADEAREALPKLRTEAKKMGIETAMEEGKSAIMVQKDAEGDWRWVGWPSNNFIDKSSDILTEAAHLEYVDWWNKSRDEQKLPVFTSFHAPGTAREHPVDFVGYQNGFLVMSGKLTEKEAAGLFRVQKSHDLGMSHTGWGIRSKEDKRQIEKYRIYEVTDLPSEAADNPFTDMVVSKEAVKMNEQEQLDYLTKLTGSAELAKESLLMKTSLKQAELKEAGIEQKGAGAQETPEGAPQAKVEAGAAIDIEKIAQELDMAGLSETIADLQKSAEKVPLLEAVIKQQAEMLVKLGADSDEQLAEILTPGVYAWSKKERASQSEDNKLEGDELEAFKKKVPALSGDNWLSDSTGTKPVVVQ